MKAFCMLWLDDTRGYLPDWITQQWVYLSGQRIDLKRDLWLAGPIGKTREIGKHFFADLADEHHLVLHRSTDGGLVSNFDQLATGVDPQVRHFYEHTASYDLDAWSQWVGLFRPFGGLLAAIFSRRLQQLNIPLSGLDTSRGITSEILQLVDPLTSEVRYTAWVRELVGTGDVLYAGNYSLCQIPRQPGMCVKVVFPLPNGNGIVIMKPETHADGSFSLISAGNGFGEPGFYFTASRPDGAIYARYVRAMRETIHVYNHGDIRANHTLRLFGQVFLRLHYRLRLRQPREAVAR